jgi:2-phospho-L-lactate guanylyltransferase
VDAAVLIPVKRLDAAKTRLAPVATPAQRRALMRRLVTHAADAAVAVVGHDAVWLATSDPAAARLAARIGVGSLSDGALPWNQGILHALAGLPAPSAVAVFLSADLPLVGAADVRALVTAAAPGTAVVARARDGGTNALALRPPAALVPAFGAASSAAVHRRRAHHAGLAAVVLDRPGLALDADTPQDLRDALAEPGLEPALRRLVERYLNRSWAGSRTSSAPAPGASGQEKPRTSAAGARSSLPMTRSAADASSSATATADERSTYPAGSVSPS